MKRGDIVYFGWSANNSATFRIQNIAGTIAFFERSEQAENETGRWLQIVHTYELDNPNDFFPVTVQWTVNLP